MILKTEILNAIKEITSDCYKENKLQLNNIYKKLDIECFESDFDDPRVSGMLIKNKETNKFEIYVNRRHSNARQRFTIVHEMGHFLSWRHNSYSYEQLNENNEIEDFAISFRHENITSDAETEANLIAAEMLMPEKKVRELAEAGLTIEEMADEFYVSSAAMTVRVQFLFKEVKFV